MRTVNLLLRAGAMLAGLLLALPAIAQTTHTVTVSDNSFSPANLTIQAGDTVRWVNAAGGNPHNVTSDDNAFDASVTASSFEFEVTFDEPGVFDYRCTVHPAIMRGTVTVEEAAAGFVINQGVSDAWFNDETAGQGFLIVVLPDQGIIFLAWFTYDTERPPEDVIALLGEPGHRWVTAQGPYDGDTAELTVYLTQGGVFDMAEPPAVTDVDNPIGTITIVWHDCSSATLTYDIDPPGVMGEIELRRIVPDNEMLCEALMEP